MAWHDAQGIPEARRIAQAAGLTLIRKGERQYTLRGPGWSIQLFPDEQRIYRGFDQGAPRLELPKDWRILDAVIAAAGAVAGSGRQKRETVE